MTGQPVFRFAPSPTGALHLGSAYSALVCHDMARAAGGRFLLRIEDIDRTRCRPEYEAQMRDDLAWLGLTWEEPVRRQSDHLDTYAEFASRLEAMGLLYPCFASRREIDEAVAGEKDHPADPDGSPLYPGLCKGMRQDETAERQRRGEPYALRIDMEKAVRAARETAGGATLAFTETDKGEAQTIPADPGRWGDAVIVRKDVPASYHLSVVVDDALQGVTHVTRGRDLFAATGLHRLLQALLELPEPVYHHHPLLLDGQGRKLSKSEASPGIAELREKGLTPGEVRALALGKLAESRRNC